MLARVIKGVLLYAAILDFSALAFTDQSKFLENPQKLVRQLIESSGISDSTVNKIKDQFIERYQEEEKKLNFQEMNTALMSEFDRVSKVLKKSVDLLKCEVKEDSRTENFLTLLNALKELTEDGFYQTATLYSYDVALDKRTEVKELIQSYWQLLWQAREIMTFKVASNYSSSMVYKLSDLLVDISSAIDWTTNRSSFITNKMEAAKISQISFCLGAQLGNKSAAEEIQTYEDNLEVETYWKQLSSENEDFFAKLEEIK